MQRSDPEILYHYCSLQTFQSIIESRKIRLSGLNYSNDTYEGQLGFKLLKDKMNEISDSLYESFIIFPLVLDKPEIFGFCLSEESDLLSQWRGYANDGHGMSIGFSVEYLSKKIFKPARVLYNSPEQHSKINEFCLFWHKNYKILEGMVRKPSVEFTNEEKSTYKFFMENLVSLYCIKSKSADSDLSRPGIPT